jgi:hypothetical protein
MLRSISLIGTTSSGKSTIGNLLSGHYVLPTGVQETTTGIIELSNDCTAPFPVLSFADLNGSRTFRIALRSDREIRERISHEMMDSGETNAYIRLKLRMLSPAILRKWLTRRASIVEDLNIGHGFVIRDFPGFRDHHDITRFSLIERFIGLSDVIMFIYNAEETDADKEDRLLSFLFLLLQRQNRRWDKILFVLNRKDAFLRDKHPEGALRAACRDREFRVLKLIQETWGNKQSDDTSKIRFVALSAGPVLATELLWWRAGELSEADRAHLCDQVGKRTIQLLPESLRDTLPRSIDNWSRKEFLAVVQSIYRSSGVPELLHAMETIRLYQAIA